jgi:hypothetical protein
MKRIAIIINGDTEKRHLENVERSLAVLRAKGFETYVASTQNPGVAGDYYVDATASKIGPMMTRFLIRTSRAKAAVCLANGLTIYCKAIGATMAGGPPEKSHQIPRAHNSKTKIQHQHRLTTASSHSIHR